MAEPYTEFKATTDFNRTLLTSELEYNLQSFLKWAFLRIGAWADVNIPSSGYYGGNFHDLTAVVDPSYDEYQVWETPRKDLIYETNVDFGVDDLNPIEVSGVWVNDVFYEPDDATYGHYLDYANGRIVFTTPLVEDDTVKMNYSYRTVSVELADESNLWKELQYGTLRVDDTHRSDPDKGQWAAIPALKRQQLPAVIIEGVSRGSNKGWEIGSQAQIVFRDILFRVVAENRHIRNNICDILALEENKTIWLFNSDNIVETTDWPLDFKGAKNEAGLTYPNLIEIHKWLRSKFFKTYLSETESKNPYLHEGTVRVTFETIHTRD